MNPSATMGRITGDSKTRRRGGRRTNDAGLAVYSIGSISIVVAAVAVSPFGVVSLSVSMFLVIVHSMWFGVVGVCGRRHGCIFPRP